MTKLTKRQLRSHQEACDLLDKETLTFEEKWFVYENWHEGFENDVTGSGAHFTPIELARDVGFDVVGPRVLDLCAGIGALAFAWYHCRNSYLEQAEITCVEINPRFVEVGKKLLPEANWICGDVFDVARTLGHFDGVVSNPPFGRISAPGKSGPCYTGAEFEFKIIDLASQLAEYGAFLIPQGSAPFHYSGRRCHEYRDSKKHSSFSKQTGLVLDAGVGVDTSVYEGWKSTNILCEVVTCEFSHQAPIGKQYSMFDMNASLQMQAF